MEEKIQTIKTWLGSGSINLFGAPFAGKDTQAKKLAEMLGGELLSSGDLLRQSKDNPKIQESMASGANIPSELFFEAVLPHLMTKELEGKPLILSEMGRKNQEEAQGTIDTLDKAGHPQKVVVLLSLSEEEAWKRFEQAKLQGDRGDRADDNDSALQIRLDKFRNEIMPVIENYRNAGQLIEVNGIKTREYVTEEIVDALYAKAISVG